MKKGTCALCGYREEAKKVKQQSTDRPGERTIFAQEDGKAGNLLTVTLSNEDLAALKKADVSTVLIRGEERQLFFERTSTLFGSRLGRWWVEQPG